MRCCFAIIFAFALSSISGNAAGQETAGIEAAETAEQLIAACRSENIITAPRCLNYNLNRKWKHELAYAGKPFSAKGQIDGIRKSLLGNLFVFVSIGQYWVSCKVTEQYAAKVDNIERNHAVLVSGILDSYHRSFNALRFHHLRLAPYCSIEIIV